MNLTRRLLMKLSGLKFTQDYLCIDKQTFESTLRVYLTNQGVIVNEISTTHTFVGYSPLIFAIQFYPGHTIPTTAEIIFSQKLLSPNERFGKKDAVASLKMEKIHEMASGGLNLGFYRGKKGSHSFLPGLNQSAISLHDKLYNRKPGNVFLPGNLLSQVHIAYAVPRTISLITVKEGENFNLFPTDLHGPVGESHYLISLRHAGKACAQVIRQQRILLSEMNPAMYRQVYSLGRNHMQDPKPRENFPFGREISKAFGLPVPDGMARYRELALEERFEYGIHRIMLFRVENSFAGEESHTLTHVHNVYATWRHKQGQAGNYLLR